MIIPGIIAKGSGGGAPPTTDLVHMMFNGVDAGTVFDDDGTEGATWTHSGAVDTHGTSYGVAQEGIASLRVSGPTAYLTAAYAGWLPAAADFFIGFWFRPQAGLTSKYLMGVNGSGSAADRAVVFYVDSSDFLNVFWSDGSSVDFMVFGAVTSGNWYYVRVERVGNTIYASLNNTAPTTKAFSGSINAPGGSPEWRIGANAAGDGVSNFNIDMFQIKDSAPYSGGTIASPPTTPV